jgi:ribulose-5-phosphate 4-epimerase/fuculose-1-phosphate aldolase
MTDLIYNHITARVPGTNNEFLINSYGMMYEEVTASSLIMIDIEGNVLLQADDEYAVNVGGYVIHSAVHSARHDIFCVAHTHTEAGMAVAAMKCGLLPLSQQAMQVINEVGYHDFEGPAVDVDERARVIADLGDKFMLILRNHGLLACGRSIPEAFRYLHFLEYACRAQTRAMAANTELNYPSKAAQEKSVESLANGGRNTRPQDKFGGLEWRALLRQLDRVNPGYAS